jgi:hypothetical protein
MTPEGNPRPTNAHAIRVALVLAGLSPSTGCSYLFMTPAPDNHARLPYVECTSSRVAPVIDTLVGSIYIATAAGLVVSAVTRDGPHPDWGALGGSAGIAIVSGASAVKGFGNANHCEAAVTAWEGRGRVPLPPPCSRDIDCKGERICEEGLCVAPPSTTAALRLEGR